MPPLEVIENEENFANMLRFKTSAIYEMLISLNTLRFQRRRIAWANKARSKLPPEFLSELDGVYDRFTKVVQPLELPVDYPNHDDVAGFIDYIRQMDEYTFVFYMIGRLLPIEVLAEVGLSQNMIRLAIKDHYGEDSHWCESELGDIVDDPISFQTRLVNLWEQYWHEFFQYEAPNMKQSWANGLTEAENYLGMHTVEEFLNHILGRAFMLPKPLPLNMPYTEILCIPLYLIPARASMFFGYGNVTILYDSEYTEARAAQIVQDKDAAIETLKALGDSTRMDILKMIAQWEGKINGKTLAGKLNLSASAVSRHLSQLRDGGLIIEEPLDHRNLTYRLQKETIASLPDKILEYLFN